METLSTAPFNKVRHCVFPKHYDYNHNDPELYAFEKDADGKWDVNRPCFAFWEHLEKQIFALADMGIQSDLILFHPYDKWGFSHMTMEEKSHLSGLPAPSFLQPFRRSGGLWQMSMILLWIGRWKTGTI